MRLESGSTQQTDITNKQITIMTQKQFEKFANGIVSGLQTMQDLRSNKNSLFESYPVLAEGDNWSNLVIYAREHGLQPECTHIRPVRTCAEVVSILQHRYIDIARSKRYDNMGALKHWRALINVYCKIDGVTWGWGDIKREWAKYVKLLSDNDFDNALRDYNYNSAITALVNTFATSPEWCDTVVAAIGAELLKMDDPIQFIRNWYTYTDLQGNLLVKVLYINNDRDVITTKWECRTLTRSIASGVVECALRNVKRAFRSGKLDRKYTPLKRYNQGELCGEYWSVATNDKGRVVKGDKLTDYTDVASNYTTTLADYNRELRG